VFFHLVFLSPFRLQVFLGVWSCERLLAGVRFVCTAFLLLKAMVSFPVLLASEMPLQVVVLIIIIVVVVVVVGKRNDDERRRAYGSGVPGASAGVELGAASNPSSSSSSSLPSALTDGHDASPVSKSQTVPTTGGPQRSPRRPSNNRDTKRRSSGRSKSPSRRSSSRSPSRGGDYDGGNDAGGGGAEDEELWTPNPYALSSSEFEKALTRFFRKHNEAKLPLVKKMAKIYNKKRGTFRHRFLSVCVCVCPCVCVVPSARLGESDSQGRSLARRVPFSSIGHVGR
jgi:hypothetical protein